jgi:hypothetical protein
MILLRFSALALMFWAGVAQAQYRNYEVTPNQSGGAHGTYGNENFEIDRSTGDVSGHIGGRRPGTLSERPSQTPGNIGATQSRCYVDGEGRSACY